VVQRHAEVAHDLDEHGDDNVRVERGQQHREPTDADRDPVARRRVFLPGPAGVDRLREH
jgi:hypothetical protein